MRFLGFWTPGVPPLDRSRKNLQNDGVISSGTRMAIQFMAKIILWKPVKEGVEVCPNGQGYRLHVRPGAEKPSPPRGGHLAAWKKDSRRSSFYAWFQKDIFWHKLGRHASSGRNNTNFLHVFSRSIQWWYSWGPKPKRIHQQLRHMFFVFFFAARATPGLG